jgi:hypothetical protein
MWVTSLLHRVELCAKTIYLAFAKKKIFIYQQSDYQLIMKYDLPWGK